MTIVENRENTGRTIWGVLGHEAHVELVDGRYIVAARRRTARRRTVQVFGTFEQATEYLTNWTASEQKGR